MTKSKKRLRETQEQSIHRSLDQEIVSRDDAYVNGAFKYLRFLVHLLGTSQFAYGIYYNWFHVNPSVDITEEEDLKARWGGKFKYLTFLDVILQALYHSIALLNDMFGSNALIPQPASVLRTIKDYIFAAFAFPVAHNVCISFWVIYTIDRELIFPAALDSIFPNWLNHIVHTNVAMLAFFDLFTCFRQYPSRVAGVAGTMSFMILYIIWIHIVQFFSGQWVYPLLEILNAPLRYAMFGGMLAFTVFCYFLGEFVNNLIWEPELKLLKQKKLKKT